MIDLTGPARPWSTGLTTRFARAYDRCVRATPWWKATAPRGEPGLLERLAELFDAPPDRTVVTGGVRHFALGWAGRTARAIVESPTFSDIPAILGAGAPVQSVSWPALADAADAAGGPATVWLTSPFRNPDGRSLDAHLAATVDGLVDRGHTAVVNQVYRWYADTGPLAPVRAWTVTSLAKVAGGGVKLGWATAPAAGDIGPELTRAGPATAWQRAWAGFLDRPTYRALRSDCVEPTLAARTAFADRTRDLLGWNVPGGGLSVLLACLDTTQDTAKDTTQDTGHETAGETAEKTAVARLAAAGLRVSPGSAFGSPVPSVRLAFSGTTVAEAGQAAERIARLDGALQPWDGGVQPCKVLS
jgi:DNA-binding transcriptional MocR family regulator